jgi:hypothetical protein
MLKYLDNRIPACKVSGGKMGHFNDNDSSGKWRFKRRE